MRILLVSPYALTPARDGARRRISEIAFGVARRETLTVLSPAGPEDSSAWPFEHCRFGSEGLRHQVFSYALARQLRKLLDAERFDLVWLEHIWNGGSLNLARATHKPPFVLDAPDVISAYPQQITPALRPFILPYERWVARQAKQVFVASNVDLERFRKLGISAERLTIVPNGVNTVQFRPDPKGRELVREQLEAGTEKLLLFFGQMTYPPNAEAVDILVRRILPGLEAGFRVVIAGSGLSKEAEQRLSALPRVSVTGPVDHIADYINAADAVVVPLVHGTGTRLKILESIACGAPVVTTSIGAEGLDRGALGEHVIVEDNWGEWPDAIRRAASMNNQAPDQAFVAQYDWRGIVARIVLLEPSGGSG